MLSDQIPFRYILATALMRSTDPDKALDQYREILTADKSEAPNIVVAIKDFLKTYPDYPEANFLLSTALVKEGLYSESVTVTYNNLYPFQSLHHTLILASLQ